MKDILFAGRRRGGIIFKSRIKDQKSKLEVFAGNVREKIGSGVHCRVQKF